MASSILLEWSLATWEVFYYYFFILKIHLLWKIWPISIKRWKQAWIRAWEKQEDNSTDDICYLENTLQNWTTLYLLNLLINTIEDELNIDGGKHVLACFEFRNNYFEWIIKQLLILAFVLSEELWKSWKVLSASASPRSLSWYSSDNTKAEFNNC